MQIENSYKSSLAQIDKTYKALEKGKYTKIICGASNNSELQIERISMIYSLSGAHVIDVGPFKNAIDAAKRGIAKAKQISESKIGLFPRFNESVVMTSLNVGDDKHFRKADINITKCISCLECLKSCQSRAISQADGRFSFDNEKCYGCAKCVEVCQNNAVKMIKPRDDFKKRYPEFLKTEAIELHTGNKKIEDIRTFAELHSPIVKNAKIISVSIESKRFNPIELVNFADEVTKLFDKKIILQVDGHMMRGGTSNAATLQTLSSAAEIIEAKVNAYIQLAGGTNHITRDLVNQLDIKVAGIGYGTFAKKIILKYIEDLNDGELLNSLSEVVNITTSLVAK